MQKNSPKYIGDIKDPRTRSERDKDYRTEEVDMGIVKFVTRKQAEATAKKYIERNQYAKSSCVPSSIANALFNTEKVVLADEPTYSMRANKPQQGCWWANIADMVVNRGMDRREDFAELKTEAEANRVLVDTEMDKKALRHKQERYLWLKERNFNDIATWINSGYAVPFSIYAELNEWKLKRPEILNPSLLIENAYINHAICAIPNTAFKDKNGYGFFITDSSPFGGYFKREITQAFYEKRMKHGIVFEDFKYEVVDTKLPFKYTWTRDLTVGDSGEDVLKLQQALQWLGHFPVNKTPTGYFGGITRQAVKDFQEKYKTDILLKIGLTNATGYFRKSTRNKLNSM